MKEIEDFLCDRTIEFGPIMNNIPSYLIKQWIEGYKTLKDKTISFEDYVKENSWMIVDSSYMKIKHYLVFTLDPKNTKKIVSDSSLLKTLNNYFEEIFNKSFMKSGQLDKVNLLRWAKEYHYKKEADYYENLVNRLDLMDKAEITNILLGLFIYSLGVSVENYFELCDKDPISLEDAEYILQSYVDCSDQNIEIKKKWEFIYKHGELLNGRVIRTILYKMISIYSYKMNSEQRKLVLRLSNIKAKKLKLSSVQEILDIDNQHLFCSLWQEVNGL